MAGSKIKADCRADTRGGSWAGIPKCLIDSPAYRGLSLHARAVLVEMVGRMNGYNNGTLTAPQRELLASLHCSASMVSKAVAELIEHGIVAVGADARWKDNRAREYRLTFVTTKGTGATNDYLRWTPAPAKKIGAAAVSLGGPSDTPAVSVTRKFDAAAVSRIAAARGEAPAATDTPAVSLIDIPYPGRDAEAVDPLLDHLPPTASCHRKACVSRGVCEQCAGFMPGPPRPNVAVTKRFCSEQCRKLAERARAKARRHAAAAGPNLRRFHASPAQAADRKAYA